MASSLPEEVHHQYSTPPSEETLNHLEGRLDCVAEVYNTLSDMESPRHAQRDYMSRQKSLHSDGSPAISESSWGGPRSVILHRIPGKSLGISIVGKCFLSTLLEQ